MATSTEPGEQVILTSRPHWVILLGPGVLAAIGFLCTVCSILPMLNPPPGQNPPPVEGARLMAGCSSCILLLALFMAVYALIVFITSEFTLTDRRVMVESGVLGRRSKEIFLNKVESVSVETPLLGRLLNYGTIVITGSGGAREYLNRISNPQEIRSQIQHQIARPSHGQRRDPAW